MNIAELIMFSRSMRILGLVIFLSIFLCWYLIFGAPGELVNERRLAGKIIEQTKLGYLVRLDDGQTVQVPTQTGMASGEAVVLRERTYSSGHKEISFDVVDQW